MNFGSSDGTSNSHMDSAIFRVHRAVVSKGNRNESMPKETTIDDNLFLWLETKSQNERAIRKSNGEM